MFHSPSSFTFITYSYHILTNYNNIENTTHSNTVKITEEATSVIEHEELETLIIASIETLKQQKMKYGIDEVLELVQGSLKENIS